MKKNSSKSAQKATRKSAKPRGAPITESVTSARRLVEVPIDTKSLKKGIDLIGDSKQSVEMRCQAMQAVQAASFSLPEFESMRSDYVAVLRIAAKDPDHELRQRSLGILARENDSFAQRVLLEGLQDEKKALLPPEKALQLLSYNAHSGASSIARKLFGSSTNDSVKQEALRLMSGDPDSAKVIAQTLADKSESPDIRRLSAAALHVLNPQSLQNWANKAVLDKSENHDIVATCLTAMHEFGDAKNYADNKPLLKRLGELKSKSPIKVKQLAKQFTAKYGL